MLRRAWLLTHVACVAGIAVASPARADVRDYIGQPIAEVRVELGGQPATEPVILELIQTRVGEPLRLEQVRETIDHLIGLGRFEDVRVYATRAAQRADAVSLRWLLAPIQRIEKVDIAGNAELDASAIRTELNERMGQRPSVARLPEIVSALRAYYSDRGFRSPRVDSQIVGTGVSELVTLRLTIDAGTRTRIGHVTVTGTPAIPVAQLLARLDLQTGHPYDRPAITARISRYEEELRGLGYYEASIDLSTAFAEDTPIANLTLDVDPGPRVRVVFAGDPLPENRREALVPIRQERSVDLDLLEDASRRIEDFLRQQGYRSAQAPYTREQRESEMVLTFTVTRGPLHTLASAEVSGNQEVPLSDLAPLLQLRPGEAFVDSRVAAIASAITELYRVRGFAQAIVRPETTVRPEQRSTTRPVTVRFNVTEGPQTMVGGVTIQGATVVPETRLRPLLALTSGKPFYRPQLDADRDVIEQIYRNEGFQSARVAADPAIADEGRRVDVRWTIREGLRTTINKVLVSGNIRTSTDLIRREVALRPGQALGEDMLVEGQRRLAALGLFRRVRITEVPHGVSSSHDVLVEVEEAPASSISEGGGLEAIKRLRRAPDGRAEARFEVAPRGFFEITRRNLWGKNRSASLFTRVSFRPRDPAIDSSNPSDLGGYGFNEYRVVGTFREPRAFDTPGEAQLTAFLEQAVRSSFNFSRRGGRAEYARRLGGALTASGRFSFEYIKRFDEQIKPEDRVLVDRLFPNVRLSTFTGSILRDSRNDALDPERGTVTGIDGSVAPRFAGSQVGFVKAFMQGALYRRLPMPSRFVMAAAARVGFAAGFEREVERRDVNNQPVLGLNGEKVIDVVKDLPASERFFAGGDTTVRGFVLDQLGAADTINDQGFPSGGNALVVLNLELRAPYWKGVGAVAFVDAGNVFKRATDFAVGDLRPAAGFGLRYRSPLGPLRADLGFNLDPQLLRSGARERSSVFHISLGQAF